MKALTSQGVLKSRLCALWFTLGGRCALPLYLLLALGFAAPLIMVIAYSFTEPKSFDVFRSFSLANYASIFDGSSSVLTSYGWSLALAAFATVSLALICYPIAVGMVRVFGPRGASLVSVLFVFPLFVSENVRLYGWILFFMKNGVLDGLAKLAGGAGPDILFTPGMTAMGIIYSYIPYMLFPMVLGAALVPRDVLSAARDLGAGRLRVFWEIELPLSLPGVIIGALLTFVLTAGAMSESKILGGQSVMVVTNEIDIAFSFAQNWPLGAALAVILMLVIAVLTLSAFIRLWTVCVLLFIYIPVICDALSSLSKGRYFSFPVRQWSLAWWEKTARSMEIGTLVSNSLTIAFCVTAAATVIAFLGALAFARYNWKGRRLYQKLILLPVFFPQPVLGLALLLWFNALGVQLSWKTAVFAHLVWITPVVTLVIAIQVYGFDPTLEDAARDLGAGKFQIFRHVTLPLMWPGIWSGMLFAFLLSWGNFPLSLYTTGIDNTVPKWLYSKMIAGYSPQVPTLGTMSTLMAAAVMLTGGVLIYSIRRRSGRS